MNAPNGRFQFACAMSLALSVWLLPASLVQADIVFDNFGPGNTFSDGGRLLQGEDVNNIGDVDQAVSFIVGPTSYLLTQLSLGIFVSSSPFVGTGPLDIAVASDAAGLPGPVLRTFSLVVNATGKQVVTAVDGALLPLDANTVYWIIADGKGTFDGSWQFNSISDIGNTAGRTDNGPWNLRVDDDRMALRVEGRIVPEPSSLLLTIGSCILLVAFARRRSCPTA